MKTIWLTFWLAGFDVAFAIDGSGVLARYRLVGVIASESQSPQKNIVVIKDRKTSRSHTLSEGQKLPGDMNWVITNVQKNRVILVNGGKSVTMRFGGFPVSGAEYELTNLDKRSKFLDNSNVLEKDVAIVNFQNGNEANVVNHVVGSASDSEPAEPVLNADQQQEEQLRRYEDLLQQRLNDLRRRRQGLSEDLREREDLREDTSRFESDDTLLDEDGYVADDDEDTSVDDFAEQGSYLDGRH